MVCPNALIVVGGLRLCFVVMIFFLLIGVVVVLFLFFVLNLPASPREHPTALVH